MQSPSDRLTQALAANDHAAAERCARELIATNGDQPAAWQTFGEAQLNQGCFTDARDSLQRALTVGEDGAILRFELASAFEQCGQIDQAVEHLRRAVALDPQMPAAQINLAALLEKADRLKEALIASRRAVEIAPGHAVAHYNLARVQQSLGEIDSAIATYSKTAQLDKKFALAYTNRGCCHLLNGNYASGWSDYEWRLATPQCKVTSYPQPRWNGSPLPQGTLLVHGEQGIGDEIQFASCVPDIVPLVKQSALVCDPRVARLMARSFPAVVIIAHDRQANPAPPKLPMPFDAQIPSGSLPMHVRPSLDHFPRRKQFLLADPTQKRAWRKRYETLGSGLKIGFSWRGGGTWEERRKRTTTLDQWRELLSVHGVQFINLQYGQVADEIAGLRQSGIELHHFDDADPLGDLDLFAAKVAALDLVISVGNATVHLAGALGMPTWCLVPAVPQWRWKIQDKTTPWYPSVHIIRQLRTDDWNSAIVPAAAKLRDHVRHPAPFDSPALKFERVVMPVATSSPSKMATVNPAPRCTSPQTTPAASTQSQVRLTQSERKHIARKAAAFFNDNRHDEAAPLAEQLLAADADNLVALRILGVVARQTKDFDRSLQLLNKALKIAPTNAPLYFDLGVTYAELKLQQQAYENFLLCVKYWPTFQPACVNLAAILEQQERYEDSLPWARKAVELKPDCPLAHYNCANQLRECGRVAEAIPHYQTALRLKPDYIKARWNLAICHLLLGDYANGWPLFEVREIADEVKFDKFIQPRWDGSSLAGKTIVVHAEQGLGDEVLFATCFDDVISTAKKTIITCEPRLLKLLQRSFPKATIYPWTRRRDWSPLPLAEPVDWQIPAGSLPAYVRTTAESFPLRNGFLTADHEQIAVWRKRFTALGTGLKVGLSWRAGGKANEGRKRTISLSDWQQILRTPNVDFINLQYGDISEDAAEIQREFGVTIHDHEEGDPLVDVDAYAAKIAALDLVISVGNAAVHLAGALDVPAWTMLPRVPSWRWMVTGEVSPWYPSVRLFRQPRRTDWQPVLDQISARLSEVASQAADKPSQSLIAASIRAVMPQNVAPDASPIAPPESQSDRWLDAKDLGSRQPHQVMAMLDEQAEAARAQGNLVDAERLYREILQITPRQMKAHVGLGIVARETGRMDLAIRSLQRALTMFEPHAANHAFLATILLDVGRNDEALTHARRALELDPNLATAKHELARALKATGQHGVTESATKPRQAPTTQPVAASESCSRARALAAKGNLDAAIDLLRTAIAKYPVEPQLRIALAEFLLEDQRFDDAAEALATATRLDPSNADAHIRLSLLHEQLGDTDSAIAAARTAVQYATAHLPATIHLGKLLRQAGAPAEAEILYREVIDQLGQSADLCNLLGIALTDQCRDTEALVQYDRAIQLNHNHSPAHSNRALALLRQENFAAGWDEYDWRWQSGQEDLFAKKFLQPKWAGQSLEGKSIVVYGEQGLGDEIMFASCLPDLINQAKRCVLVCDARLERLFRRSFPNGIVLGVARGNEHIWKLPTSPAVDFQSAAGTLPRYLRRSADQFPQQPHLLIPDSAIVAHFAQQFATLGPGKKIGISWRTGEGAREAARRSIPLSFWTPLFELPGINWFNLQAGDCRAELSEAAKFGANFQSATSTDNQFDLDRLAAKIAALDLVITVDNSTAHIAAAVGTTTMIALPEPADWRWFANRDDSPWYGAVRLFRQDRPQRWDKVFQQLRSELLKPTLRLDEKSNRAAPRAPHWSVARAAYNVD